jgi:hypothetical protein
VFGPYEVGAPTPFPLGLYKSKFDTGKAIRIAMFSEPIVLYSGPWPADDTPIVTPNLGGHHKFIIFGTAPDGSPTYAGCETDGETDDLTTAGTTAGATTGGTTTAGAPGGTTTAGAPGGTTTAGSTGGTTGTKLQVGGTSAKPGASTGASIGSTTFIASALLIVGAVLVLAFGRRRTQPAT